MNKSLGIIIVNYNSSNLLKQCVDSVFNSNLDNILLKVVIVDNNSTDNSLNLGRSESQELHIIRNKVNHGFGKACNQGSDFIKDKEHLLFLNPDTVLSTNTIIDSLSFLQKDKNISILGLCHTDIKGKIKPSCSRTPTVKRIFWDIFGLSKMLPKVFKPATVMTDNNHKKSMFVDQVMGAFMLMQTKVFEKVDKFDTDFFVYYEDADFALRAKNMGFKSYYNANIKIIHHGRGTTEKISDISLFYNLRSRIQFVNKHYGSFNGFLIKLATYTVEPVTRIIFSVLKGKNEVKNIFSTFTKLYKNSKK